jgi:hypothetical protein
VDSKPSFFAVWANKSALPKGGPEQHCDLLSAYQSVNWVLACVDAVVFVTWLSSKFVLVLLLIASVVTSNNPQNIARFRAFFSNCQQTNA